MKHASTETLKSLDSLLEKLRQREVLREKRTGAFFVESRAFLHFHEDPKGLFADVRLGTDWSRLPVTTRRQQEALLGKVDRFLKKLAAA
jgi:hypothetical protein